MHFSIPETQYIKDEKQNSYIAYNIHVNGSFHCTVRYKQLHSFHDQLRKAFGQQNLPIFPPKKLLPLTQTQVEERRSLLEKYIQIVSQDERIRKSDLFNGFFLNAQQETLNAKNEEIDLVIQLINLDKAVIKAQSIDNTSVILDILANQINLDQNLLQYFQLFLVTTNNEKNYLNGEQNNGNKFDNHENHEQISFNKNNFHNNNNGNNNYILVRKLQDFESPYLTMFAANNFLQRKYYLLLRKITWDLSTDDFLLDNQVALNLIYYQTISDINNGWIQLTKESKRQLFSLQAKGSKLEFMNHARNLKYYGYIQFETCLCNYPQPNSHVVVLAGGKELIIKVLVTSGQMKEFAFKVTRVRCWRLTTSPLDSSSSSSSLTSASSSSSSSSSSLKQNSSKLTKYELSFEYLFSKDQLKWITINSEQAILISICLKNMVDELLSKRKENNTPINDAYTNLSDLMSKTQNKGRRDSWCYMKRDGSSHQIALPRSISSDTFNSTSSASIASECKNASTTRRKHFNEKINKNRSFVENDAFDGIGDDDL